MKRLQTADVRPIRVKQNTVARKPDWLAVVDDNTGEVIHTGRPSYIRRLARTRYLKAFDVTVR